MTIDDVTLAYKQWGSIKETARRLEISEGVVRKCLVGRGIIDTPLTRRIAELRRQGAAQADIAQAIGVSVSCVNANTPYARGMMIDPSQTVNAQRIRKSREKKVKKLKESPL